MKIILASLLLIGIAASATDTNSALSVINDPLGARLQVYTATLFTNQNSTAQLYISRSIVEGQVKCMLGASIFRTTPHELGPFVILLCDQRRMKMFSEKVPAPEKDGDEWYMRWTYDLPHPELATIIGAKNIKLRISIDGTDTDFDCAEMNRIQAFARYCATNPVPKTLTPTHITIAIPNTPTPEKMSTPASQQIPPSVLNEIKRAAAKDSPGNYFIQELSIEQQAEAYKRLHGIK